jgi:hypothetical protein
VYQRKFGLIDQFAALSRSLLRLLAYAGLAMALASGAAVANSKYAGIVVDAKTGKTLYAHDADELRFPASSDQDDDTLHGVRGAASSARSSSTPASCSPQMPQKNRRPSSAFAQASRSRSNRRSMPW